MAQTNYTPIQLYNSATATATPSASNLAFGELAINYRDGKLFYKDFSGTVQVLATQAGSASDITGGAAGSIVYQDGVSSTTFLNLGSTGNILIAGSTAPEYAAPSTLTIGTATNIAGGAANSLPYQTAAGTTGFVSAGTNGQVLTISGGVPTWATSGTATLATNIAGGTAGTLVYQSGADTTAFVTAGTAGQLLVSAGTSAPAWTSGSSISVGSATTAANIASGTLGAIPYQLGSGSTTFLSLGVTNNVLTAGIAGPQFVAQSTLSVGASTNLVGGSAGSVPYQTGAGTTAFVSPGTTGFVLTSNGTGAPTWTAGSSVSLASNNTWTGTQSFVGSTTAVAEKLRNASEIINLVGTAIPSSATVFVSNGAVTFYAGAATSNFTLNLSFSSGVSLDGAMAIGEALTVAILVKTSTTTPYYLTSVQIDSGFSSSTRVWLGGAPTTGSFGLRNIDVYTLTLVKTDIAVFTVLGAQSSYSS